MGVMKFPYVKFLVTPVGIKPEQFVFRPVIPVSLYSGKKVVTFDALIDSGADENTFPGWVAQMLGYDLHRGKEKIFSGIGGSVLSYEHPTGFRIREISLKSDVYYSNEWNDMPFGLLGEAGFFAHFDVAFSYEKKEITLAHKK